MEKINKNEETSTGLRPAIYTTTITRSHKTKWPKDKSPTRPGETIWPKDKSPTRPPPKNTPVKKSDTMQELGSVGRLQQLDTSLEPHGSNNTAGSNDNGNGLKISNDFMQKSLSSHNVRLKAPSLQALKNLNCSTPREAVS
jgi:hypothetical protein